MACWCCGECPNYLRAHKMFFNMMRWQHFWISSWPVKGNPLSGFHTVQTWLPPWLLPVGLSKDKVYIPWMPWTPNLKDQIQTVIAKKMNSLYCKMFGVMSRVHTESAWSTKKNYISCSLEWCVFNFCMPFTFLPMNLRNDSHPLYSPLHKIQLYTKS
jgi:hypothetical protein